MLLMDTKAKGRLICSCLPVGLLLWGNSTDRLSPSLLVQIDPGKGLPAWDKADYVLFFLKTLRGAPLPTRTSECLAGPSVGSFKVLLRPRRLPLLRALQSSPLGAQPLPTSQSR